MRALVRHVPALVASSVLTSAALAFAGSGAGEDIRDIRAPLPIPPWWRWPLAVAVAAVAALAIVLLVRAWRKRRSRALTPLERAREALLVADAHARAGRFREWADVVSETARAALAARLGAEVLPQTTSELADAPWAKRAHEGAAPTVEGDPKGTPLPEARQIVELLRTCDLARFARARLETVELVEQTAIARQLVEQLMPGESPPSPAVQLQAEPLTS